MRGMQERKYKVAGLMSGTSLDGLDIAVCEYTFSNNQWTYNTIAAETINYSDTFKKTLIDAMNFSGEDLIALDRDFGKFQGEMVTAFLQKHQLSVDLISAHGHTIFHNPAKGYTLQIGNGASLHAACSVPVVTDLRSLDVALGGQGAPLVPLGDEILFSDYAACINLGGIANISFIKDNKNIAFDICPVNIILNYLSSKIGLAYDDSGRLASQGEIIIPLLESLDKLEFYLKAAPKSLGREWIEESVFPLLQQYEYHSMNDLLYTCTMHIVNQISLGLKHIPPNEKDMNVLITGGGAFNTFLIQKLKNTISENLKIVIPDSNTIQFKEAIIFGFLGLLRMLNMTNTKKTVTGATEDSISGAVYGNFNFFCEV
jgi:anhydro-N-acetylmuramic acid kinase